jgi:hypothetical protein
MPDQQPVIERMQTLAQQWKAASDRRAIFLDCYLVMTRNMLAALDAGEFHDPVWVQALLERFAGYYFEALDDYEQASPATPAVWRVAHAAACEPKTFILQNLMLGINAHINYDLVFALVDLLDREWSQLSRQEREQRYADHCHVNHVIGESIDAVQANVIEPLDPELRVVDEMLGPVDEWLTSHLIARWREEVWEKAVALLETSEQPAREQLRRQVEAATLKRADVILLKDNLLALGRLL